MIFLLVVCDQDSIRLQHHHGYGALQACFEDEWFQAVIINETVFRNDSSLTNAIEFQFVPSNNRVTVELIGTSIYPNFVIECSNESRNNFINKSKHIAIMPAVYLGDSSPKLNINGLLEDTVYQCCITGISNGRSSTTIPSISTKCKLVRTLLTKTELSSSSGTIITLGTLLGTVTILCMCSTMFICLYKKSKCVQR